MINPLVLDLHNPDIESDDFSVISIISKIETGDDVDNDDFTFFLKKSWEMIHNLQRMTQ